MMVGGCFSAIGNGTVTGAISALNTGTGNGILKVKYVNVNNNGELQNFLSYLTENTLSIKLTILNVAYFNNPIYTAINKTGGGAGLALSYMVDDKYGCVAYFGYSINKIIKCDFMNGEWMSWNALYN